MTRRARKAMELAAANAAGVGAGGPLDPAFGRPAPGGGGDAGRRSRTGEKRNDTTGEEGDGTGGGQRGGAGRGSAAGPGVRGPAPMAPGGRVRASRRRARTTYVRAAPPHRRP